LSSPAVHSTNPSGIERHADPDPSLESTDNSLSLNSSPRAPAAAAVSAANPDADEAIPTLSGKVFSVFTTALVLSPANPLIRSKCFETRTAKLEVGGNSIPPEITLFSVKPESNLTLVIVFALLKFTEIELLHGSLNLASFFPQYLTKARFDGAIAVHGFIVAQLILIRITCSFNVITGFRFSCTLPLHCAWIYTE
jgi:hypothetical protein